MLHLLNGAADQIRTDDLLHGKQTLYQLSYNRMKTSEPDLKDRARNCQRKKRELFVLLFKGLDYFLVAWVLKTPIK